MLKEVQGQPVDQKALDDTLGQLAKRFNLDPTTVSNVRGMAQRVLSGESIHKVIDEVQQP